MSTQTSTIPASGIPIGFGHRLRDERKRLKMNQTEFALVGGVGRLAQYQYEKEVSAPNTNYLDAIAKIGVNLNYLVLGIRFDSGRLTAEQEQRVQDKVLEWLELCTDTTPGGKLSLETKKVLARLFRGLLSQIELGQLPADFDPMALMGSQLAVIGQDKG